MMIDAQGIGKRFGTQWIFRNVNLALKPGSTYAITGSNGSGKSTLLKTLAGLVTQNEGTITYTLEQQAISADMFPAHLSFSSPYMELIEELTVGEMVNFHASMRPLLVSLEELSEQIKISNDLEIRNLSSGMKQRLKLALAIFTKGSALFVDEPTANFDNEWSNWYLETISKYRGNRLVIIASNHEAEYKDLAKEVFSMNLWK